MDGGPTSRYVDELGPERILAFVIDQHLIGAVFVLKWIAHARDSAVASSIDQDKIKFKKPPNSTLAIAKDFCVSSRSLETVLPCLVWTAQNPKRKYLKHLESFFVPP